GSGLGRTTPDPQPRTGTPLESTVHRTCLTRAVSSCPRLYTVRSARIMFVILVFACKTVVWSRSPKCLPIFGSDESVSSRDRYMATWRGYTMFCDRLCEQSSSSDSENRSQITSWILSIVTCATSPWG